MAKNYVQKWTLNDVDKSVSTHCTCPAGGLPTPPRLYIDMLRLSNAPRILRAAFGSSSPSTRMFALMLVNIDKPPRFVPNSLYSPHLSIEARRCALIARSHITYSTHILTCVRNSRTGNTCDTICVNTREHRVCDESDDDMNV